MSELYEMEFGIFDHKNHSHDRPLSGVAFHPCQDVMESSGLKKVIKSYVDANIKEEYGLNILQFMDLPVGITQVLVEMSLETKNKKMQANADVMRDVEKEFNKQR